MMYRHLAFCCRCYPMQLCEHISDWPSPVVQPRTSFPPLGRHFSLSCTITSNTTSAFESVVTFDREINCHTAVTVIGVAGVIV